VMPLYSSVSYVFMGVNAFYWFSVSIASTLTNPHRHASHNRNRHTKQRKAVL